MPEKRRQPPDCFSGEDDMAVACAVDYMAD